MENKPIRVLRIVSIMNRGGIETQIMNIYREIDRSKFQFDFLVTREEEGIFDKEIKQLGGKIYNIPSVRKVGLFKFIKSVNSFFKEHNEYKIVHCHMNTWSGLFLNIANKYNVPVRIAQSHSAPQSSKDLNIKDFIENKFKSIMKIFIKHGATHFWACGKEAGEWLYGKKIAETKMTIVPNAKDIRKFQYNERRREEMRKQLNISSETLVLGHVGSFTEVKNQKFVVDVFYELVKKDIDCKLCFVGDGPLKETIERKVYKLKLTNKVIFLGLRNDVNKLMSMFDIILLPSFFEGMPNVIIEAQAAALPCIISDNITSEVDMDMGLVEFVSLNQSPKYWAQNVMKKRYLDRHISTDNLIKRGYDMQTFIKWLEDFYSNIIFKNEI